MDFIEKLKFRKEYCTLDGISSEIIDEKYTNIYVKVTEVCNAKCSFCTFCTNEKISVRFRKFGTILRTLVDNNIAINKISFTGGEPTKALGHLQCYFNIIEQILPYKPFIVVNTNGFNLGWLFNNKFVDNISLSYHAIDASTRSLIAGTNTIAKDEDIQKCSEKIHLTCNLIKGIVDSEESIITYLEKAKSLGVYDVGFVSLMKVNKFCEEHHVDFSDITFSEPSIVCNKQWHFKDLCKCNNYIYLPKDGQKVVKFYSRYRCRNTAASESNCVYDGEYLRENFDGTIIY